MINFRLHYRKDRGYILPATLMLSLGIAIFSVTLLQTTASSSDTLNTQSYQAIADDAARSGITYADSCLQQGPTVATWTNANQLKPNTACNGTTISGSSYVAQQGSEWRSYFTVAPADADNNVVSTGYVEILNNNIKVKTYKTTVKMPVSSSYITYPISSGESITNLKAQNSDCAIANGKLYCWGSNASGELGDGTTAGKSNPTLIQGALAGKTVTAVDISDTTTCAIGDGVPYCWGGNGQGQLGSGNTTSVKQPTAGYPKISSGDLSGQFITDISTAPMNWPAVMALWPGAIAVQHSCALKADGTMACWGSNGYRQLSTKVGFCGGIPFVGICLGIEVFAYPDSQDPQYVNGYANNSGPFAGKKAVRVGASSHDSCLIADGNMYCMGVEVPLPIQCNTPMFIPANIISINFNICNSTFSGGYDMSGKSSITANKFIDPDTWQLGTNIACGMADVNFFCVGNSPVFGIQWINSFSPPWLEMGNTDVTSHDNGEDSGSIGLDGFYCAIVKGVAKCKASLLAGVIYAGGGGVYSWGNLNTSAGLAGNIPTKIAAGSAHGCVAANGQLFCWGFSNGGRLANGGTPATITYATHTGKGGATPIGSKDGTYAANGPVSTGDGHTCGIANGQLFCWGRNNYGQLGTEDNSNQSQPLAIPLFKGQYVDKVSVGSNHTCAIKFAQLYCWGLNTSGQLGTGDNTNYNKPQLVAATTSGQALYGKHVTAVSAGVDNTCAIANGQLYCWGGNSNNKLGLNSATTSFNTPQAVSGKGELGTDEAVTRVSVGTNHTCAIGNSDAYCWGLNSRGQLGTGNTTNYPTPKMLTGGQAGTPTGPNSMRPSVSDISAGNNFSCGIFNGKASCWGENANGQLGAGTPSTDPACSHQTGIWPFITTVYDGRCTTPMPLSGPAGGYYATSISAGDSHACAIINGNNSATNGNIWCWGVGANGRLGNNSTANSSTPVLVNGGATVDGTAPAGAQRRVATYISAGVSNTCSVANAVVLCWGNNADSRLGDGTTAENRVPGVTSGYRFINPYARGPVF